MKTQTYSMQCSCGHTMVIDADSRLEAISKMKGMMTEEAVADHMNTLHNGQELMTQSQVHRQIEMYLRLAVPVPV